MQYSPLTLICRDFIMSRVESAIMTTAYGMHPAFSGRRPKLLLISDLYRRLTEIAEVH